MSAPLEIETFPSLPYIAHEILNIINDSHADIDDIAGMISKEPSLTARIVSTANSAFYAGQRSIHSIDDAIVRLGLNRVKVLTSSILLADSFDTKKCPEFKLDEYWYIAVQVSFCASKIAKHLGSKEAADAAYLAGLLHNIGLLLLVHIFPDEMMTVFNLKSEKPGSSLSEIEATVLGCDHHHSGRMLLSEWQLPIESVTVAEFYSVEGYNGDYSELVQVVAFSREWAISGFDTSCFDNADGHAILDLIEPKILQKIRTDCLAEEEQVRSFAQLLSK